MKKINHRERRESSACTGSVSRTAMLRGSVARPSLPPPPPSRDEHREHNRRHVVYNFALLSRKLARRGAGLAAPYQKNSSPYAVCLLGSEGTVTSKTF